MSTSVYLAAKVNEFDKVRIRDIINVVLYTKKELLYVKELILKKETERN